MKALRKFLKNVFTRYNGTSITNYTINYVLSPIYGAFLYKFLTTYYHIPRHNPDYPLGGALPLTIYSVIFYCYCSAFFQPDLDQHKHRPGEHSFPFGTSITKLGVGRFLRAVSWPINRFWFYFWHPFGQLFTHRGAVHWPIIGVWLRVLYIYAWYIFCEGILMRMHLYDPRIRIVEVWIFSFFPTLKGFGSVGFYVFCLPVFVADIFHSAVDLFESWKKGTKFCATTQKRGLVYKIFLELKDIPSALYYHLKDYVD